MLKREREVAAEAAERLARHSKQISELEARAAHRERELRAEAAERSREAETKAQELRNEMLKREREVAAEAAERLARHSKQISELEARAAHRERELRAEAAERSRETETKAQERNAELQRELRSLEADGERLRDAVGEEQAALQRSREESERLSAQLAAAKEELALTTSEHSSTQERLRRLSVDKRELELEYRSYKEHNSTSNQAQMQAITELKVTVDKLTQRVEATQVELVAKSGDVAQHQHFIRGLEEQLAQAESSRRELHNTIQELRGNIRVFCRVRPSLDLSASTIVQTDEGKIALSHAGDSYPFSFDKVFGPKSQQEELFAEVSGLVQSALDGFKVCIFAYGQTGSGKTYTMQGGEAPSSWGLIPRSLRQIFQSAELMRAKGWQWTLRASFMEVYNEVLRDLLRVEPSGKSGGAAPASTPQCHTIKHDVDWGTVVTNMTSIQVSSMEQINSLMDRAATLRAVGSTDMNSVSSRSHSIFALYLSGSNPDLNQELRGALHLVDLAGSERLDRSGAVGERLKETQSINRSLSSLVDVFMAKAEGRQHIPFRNSKLTHLMEPCLSGQGKTLMAVNVGPEANNSHETLCSLRFASQVSQCTTGGKPKRSVKALARPASAAALPPTITASRRGST